MPDESFERILRQTLHRADEGGPCPAPADLAAFFEGTLSRPERADVERHTSNCGRCAAQLAVLARLADSEPHEARRRGLQTWRWRWLIPLATAVVVFAVWTDLGERQSAPVNERFEATPQQQPSRAKPSAEPREYDKLTARSANAVRQQSADEQARQRAPQNQGPPASTVERVPVSPPVLLEGKETESGARETTAPPPPPAAAPAEAPPAAKVEESEFRVLQDTAQAPSRGAETMRPNEEPPSAETSLAKDQAASARADTFQRKSAALGAAKRRAPLIVRVSDSVLVRADDDRIERSTDGGRTWRSEYLGTTGGLMVGTCPSAEICWLGGESGRVFLRDASGQWTERSIPAGLAVVAIEAESAQHAEATARGGRRFRTTDGGRSWTAVNASAP